MKILTRLFIFLLLVGGMAACQNTPDASLSTPSPAADGQAKNYPLFKSSLVGQVQDGVLSVQDGADSPRVLIDDRQVTDMGWFLEGEQVAYTAVTANNYQLGIVDVATGEQTLLQTFTEPVRAPHPSRDGRYLSILVGTGETHDCVVDLRLLILVLDEEQQIADTYTITDFAGIPADAATTLYPVTDGYWIYDTILSVSLQPMCEENGAIASGYALNADLQQATPLRDEP
ncbi:MAG: hypothetical protein H6660_14245 [Ardenticatenaceae bacterium]|nr:hypothetical protein [Ardenticatenaceae bacterium]